MSKENMEAGFYLYFFNYLQNIENLTINISPYTAAYVMNQVRITSQHMSYHFLNGPSSATFFVYFVFLNKHYNS